MHNDPYKSPDQATPLVSRLHPPWMSRRPFILALLTLASFLSSCSKPNLTAQVAALEPELTAPAVGDVHRTTHEDRSREAYPVNVIELDFASNDAIPHLSSYYNDLLITRSGYSQTLNISTPGAIRLEYSSPHGRIYITIDAEEQPSTSSQPTAHVKLVISYLQEIH